MRELVLRVPKLAVEDILDRLLPLVPGGVRERASGRHVELVIRDAAADRGAIERAAGRWPHTLSEREAPDEWRERRRADYRPELIGGRLVVRPDWAPSSEQAEIEIVLGEAVAFGAGGHPTTRACLELMLGLEPRGAFADLGCGTGVLAILAAKLGWAPVVAVDVQPGSVRTALENAARNEVAVAGRVADLTTQAPPAAAALAANVPAAVHAAVAAGASATEVALLSGFGPDDANAVSDAYLSCGLVERRRVQTHGWTVLLLAR